MKHVDDPAQSLLLWLHVCIEVPDQEFYVFAPERMSVWRAAW